MSHPHVQIRPYQAQDAAEVYQAVRDSLEDVSQWLPDLNASLNLEGVKAYIAAQATQAPSGLHIISPLWMPTTAASWGAAD